MKILVIGGNGFIGSPLVRQLRDSNHQVAVFHRSPHPSLAGVRQIWGDRNRLSDYRPQLHAFRPEVIVDLILSSGRPARDLVEIARGIARRVVAISSMDVYRAWGVMHGVESGPWEPLPITEDSALRANRHLYTPETLQGLKSVFSWLDGSYDKIAVEEAILADRQIPGTVLRLPMVYGPGDPLHRLFPTLKRIADKRPAIIMSDDLAAWRGPRGYVENVAHAIALAATTERAAGRIYNICEEPALPEIDWQRAIAAHAGWDGRFVLLPRDRTPKHLLTPGNAAQHVVASSARIRSELGYHELYESEKAIRRTIDWEQQNPPANLRSEQFDYQHEDAALAELA